MKMHWIKIVLFILIWFPATVFATFITNGPVYKAGDLDPSFGTNGRFTYPLHCSAIEIQKDNKIVILDNGPDTLSTDQSSFNLMRLCSDGKKLDDGFSCGAGGFGSGGIVSAPFGGKFFGDVNDLDLQNDGRIVVAGTVHIPYTAQSSHLALFQYNTDGSPDNTFDTDGKIFTRFGNHFFGVDAITQPDGRIILAGSVDYNDWATPPGSEVGIVRYYKNGTLDNTFGIGGLVTTNQFSYPYTSDPRIALQSDGNILLAGGGTNATPNFKVMRFFSNGDTDNTFGTNGIVSTSFSADPLMGGVNDIAVLKDGRILVGGSALSQQSATFDDFVMAEYCDDGQLRDGTNCGADSFGSDGQVAIDFGMADDLSKFAIQNDGKIVAIGTMSGNVAIVRFNSDGSFDTHFGQGGKVMDKYQDVPESVGERDVGIQSDGKIITASDGRAYGGGNITGYCVISRYYGSDDTDGDGISDTLDQCPGTVKGTAVNSRGCSIVKVYKKIIPQRRPKGFFEYIRR